MTDLEVRLLTALLKECGPGAGVQAPDEFWTDISRRILATRPEIGDMLTALSATIEGSATAVVADLFG